MAETFEYLVMQARTVYGSSAFADEQAATQHAEKMVRDDKSPRIVVKLIAQMQADPTPSVSVSRFDQGETA